MTDTESRGLALARRPQGQGLRAGVLGFPTLLAQSIALISPTMTAVLIVPLAYSDAGKGTWIAYLFATIMLLVRRDAASTSSRGGPPRPARCTPTPAGASARVGGVMAGWTLLWCYLSSAIAGFTGFAIFSHQFLDAAGVNHQLPAGALLRDQRGDLLVRRLQGHPHLVLLTLVLEGLSCVVILAPRP